MRVFACKDLDGYCSVIQSESEPTNRENFIGSGDRWGYSILGEFSNPYCTTLTPGTFRELKRLDVVSGEFEFVEEVKVPTLLESAKNLINTNLYGMNEVQYAALTELHRAVHREESKPAPRYDEKLIDELLEMGEASGSLGALLRGNATRWTDPSNRRAAEILQELKRAKGEG